MTSSQFRSSSLFEKATLPLQFGDIGWYKGHVDMYAGELAQGREVLSAFEPGGADFGPAKSNWFGTPTWYR